MGHRAAQATSLFDCDNFDHAYWSPAWVATIGGLYRLAGADHRAVRVFLVCSALAAATLCYLATRRYAGHAAALIAVVLFLFSKLIFRFTAYYQYEVPLALLLLAFWFLVFAPPSDAMLQRFRHWERLRFASAGVLLGVAALLSPRILVFAPLALVGRLLAGKLRREGVVSLLVVAGLAVVLAPWTVNNYRCFGELIVTTTNGGINLYIGNNPWATGSYGMPPKGRYPEHVFHDSAFWYRQAFGYLRSHPTETLLLSLSKALKLWRPHYGDQAIVLGAFLAGLVRFFRWQGRPRRAAGLAFVLLAPLVVTVFHMVYFAEIRYLIPVLPFICLVGGAGVAGWCPEPSSPSGL
jgi:4-amino-4-deoxy-L-arabinose transferase-like glycosyltransferase